MPVLLSVNSGDMLSFPIDPSDGPNYSDFTFKYLDVESRKLVSLRNIHYQWRYYIKMYYEKRKYYTTLTKSYSNPGSYKIFSYPYDSWISVFNTTITVIDPFSTTTTTSTTTELATSTTDSTTLTSTTADSTTQTTSTIDLPTLTKTESSTTTSSTPLINSI